MFDPTTRAPIRRRLATPRGFDAGRALAYLAPRAFRGVEHVTADGLVRSFALERTVGRLAVRIRPGALAIEVHGGDARTADALRGAVARVFDLDAPAEDLRRVLGRDRLLAPLLAGGRDVRIARAFAPFELAVRAILGQQISVKAATTLAARVIAAHGQPLPAHGAAAAAVTHLFPTPAALASASLGPLGIVRARAAAINALAAAAASDPTLFGAPDRPLEATIAALVRLPGIGRWTAEYIALRGLGYADAFPTGDLGLVRAWSRLARRTASAADLDRRAATWRPYRGYAAMLLWSLA